MKSLLQINTSLNSAEGLSSTLATEYVAEWQTRNPGGLVMLRDLASSPVPHLDANTFKAFARPVDARDQQQREGVALSDELIAELKGAAEIVLAVPMHNFGIPSTLKAYFDHIARAGITFRYTATGPVGMLPGKKATIIATRGGRHVGTGLDTQTSYLENFLGFLGIEDTRFIYAEGTGLGESALEQAISGAREQIALLSERAALAA